MYKKHTSNYVNVEVFVADSEATNKLQFVVVFECVDS